MTKDDLEFVQQCITDGLVKGPVLELGAGYGGTTCRELISSNGMQYFCTDMAVAAVDYRADFESGEGVDEISGSKSFGTILVLNVLEHTFQPIKVLDNALRLIESGGTIVIATPCLWPIHSYPIDACRLLPDWYRQYARHSNSILIEESFVFIGYGEIRSYRTDSSDHFPRHPGLTGMSGMRSRIVHKLFNTAGRGVEYRTHMAIGAVLRKP